MKPEERIVTIVFRVVGMLTIFAALLLATEICFQNLALGEGVRALYGQPVAAGSPFAGLSYLAHLRYWLALGIACWGLVLCLFSRGLAGLIVPPLERIEIPLPVGETAYTSSASRIS